MFNRHSESEIRQEALGIFDSFKDQFAAVSTTYRQDSVIKEKCSFVEAEVVPVGLAVCCQKREKANCDEWGGAESRGNGARPVELMIMIDTCTTHRSRVPRRSSGRIKGGATTVEEERGPGLDFNLCFVCGSRP